MAGIPPYRKMIAFAGNMVAILGAVLFLSAFVWTPWQTHAWDTSESAMQTAALLAVIGMACILGGSIVSSIGIRGLAGLRFLLSLKKLFSSKKLKQPDATNIPAHR